MRQTCYASGTSVQEEYGFMALIILFASLLLIFGVAIWGRHFASQNEYWVNERETPWWMIAASVSSSTVGAGTLFGVATAGYLGGNAGAVIGIANSIGIILFGLLISPKIAKVSRVKGWYSLGDFIQGYIGIKAKKASAIVLSLAYFFFTAAQFAALSFVVQFISGLDYSIALLVAGGCILAYNFIGGLKADMRTDILQLVFMAMFIPLFYFIIVQEQSNIWSSYWQLPTEYLTGTAYQGAVFLIAAIVLIPLSVIPSVDLWQRSFAARSENEARIGFVVGGVIMAALFTAFSLLGTFSWIANPNLDANQALMHFTNMAGSPIILGLLFSGLFAAILSTADTMLLAASLSLSKDLIGKEEFQSQKRFVIGIGVLSMMAAYVVPDVINLVINAFSTILILLPVVLGIFFPWWRNEKAVIIGIIGGAIVSIAVFFVDPLMAFVPGTIISVVAYIIARKFV
jgi:SSS family solute:Na+ symporter